MQTITVDDILKDYNIPYEKKVKTFQYLNDYVMFGVNHFNGCEYFLDYVLVKFPPSTFHKNDIQINEFFTNIKRDDRTVDISLETVYRCVKKDKLAISMVVHMFKYLVGFDDDYSEILTKYINNFNNWNSDDWLYFVSTHCL